MPLILALFGVFVRQPIGGEFAMRRKVSDYILDQCLSESGVKYGIDISMTIHALDGAFKVGEVFLGQKFHKPSFPKIMPMFSQVSQAAFEATRLYFDKKRISTGKYVKLKSADHSGIDQTGAFSHKAKIPLLLAGSIRALKIEEESYRNILGETFPLVQKRLNSAEPRFDSDIWAEVLGKFIRKMLITDEDEPLFKKMGHFLAQIFIWRASTFWLEAENLSAEEAEKRILIQAKIIQKNLSLIFSN